MSAKRRAGAGSSPDLETPAAKKPKYNDDGMPTVETPETTTALGLKLVRSLKASCDKAGRLVATQFLDLPDKRQHPDYYQRIQSPMSINMIEAKLNNYEYENLDAVDMDFKVLIANAKEFNERSSGIFEDAERIRKAISNYMPRYNPRYKDRNTKSQHTPIVRTNSFSKNPRPTESRDTDMDGDSKPKSLKLRLTNKRPMTLTPTVDESQNSSFANDDRQSAQERIMEELIQLKDSSGREVALDFLELPSKRQYPEYYKQISHPVSLLGIQTQVKGGRKFSSWDDFRKEISFIWDNAKSYNVDESSIFQDAERLEKFFGLRFAEARLHVKDGSENQDSATVPRRIKIKPPSAPTPTATPGVYVDDDALGRQRAMVRAGSSGQDVRAKGKNAFGASTPSSSSVPTLEQPESRNGRSVSTASPKPPASTVTVESKPTPSPTPNALPAKRPVETPSTPQPPANPTMAPPTAPTPQAASTIPVPRPPAPAPYSVLDSRFRKTGIDAQNALIAGIKVSTHPGIDVEDRFRMDFGPDDTKTQQSFGIHLHHDHYYLQVEVTLTELCMSRPHKLVMSRNFETFPETGKKTAYSWRIKPGVNNITAEVIAGPITPPAKGHADPMEGYDFEKTTLHVNLLSW